MEVEISGDTAEEASAFPFKVGTKKEICIQWAKLYNHEIM